MRRDAARSASSESFGRVFVGSRTGHAKNAVGSIDDSALFVFREVAVDVELLEFGLFFGEEMVVFSEAKGFAVEAGERIEETNVVEGVGLEFALLEDAENFGQSDLNECFLEFGAVGKFGHFGACFASDTKVIAPVLTAQVILVTTFAPFGEVAGFEVFGVVTEVFNDLWVGAAIIEPLVDFVAEGFGEAGNFAVAFVARGDADGIYDF